MSILYLILSAPLTVCCVVFLEFACEHDGHHKKVDYTFRRHIEKKLAEEITMGHYMTIVALLLFGPLVFPFLALFTTILLLISFSKYTSREFVRLFSWKRDEEQ